MHQAKKDKPGTEPYLAAHHMILAHARAVRRYRNEFQLAQNGLIGLTVNIDWSEPLGGSELNIAASQRNMDWNLGLFVDPIYHGDYPESIRSTLRERLPKFTEAEKEMIRGSNDFFGLNHYSTKYTKAPRGQDTVSLSMWGVKQEGGFFEDKRSEEFSDPQWPKTHMGWDVVPWGLHHVLLYIQRRYHPTHGIIITENGCAVEEVNVKDARDDDFRVNFFQMYIAQVHAAIQEGADVRGYFAWSFLDNFEWGLGYSKCFGIVHVDYDTQVRTPKASSRLLSELAKTNTLTITDDVLSASGYKPLSNEFLMGMM